MDQRLKSYQSILEIVNGKCVVNGDLFTGEIRIDSREVKPGDLFIPIKGERFDGHSFIEGLPHGVAVLTENRSILPPEPLFVIEVEDTLKAFHQIARENRLLFQKPVIGITGSNGKTSTKELLRQVLIRGEFNPFASHKNFNNQIGVPLNLLKLNQEYDFAIIEMGTSEPGEIEILRRMVLPDVGVITSIAPAHLEGFGTIEGILKEKTDLFNETEICVVQGDNDYLKEYAAKHPDILIAGRSDDADLKLDSIAITTEGYAIECSWKAHQYHLDLSVEGRHNIDNLLTGLLALLMSGLTPDQVFQAANQLSYQIEGRLTTWVYQDRITFYDDSYNANYGSIEAGLAFFNQKKHQKKVVILGEIGELGAQSAFYHRKVGALVAEIPYHFIFLLGEEMTFAADYLEGYENMLWTTDRSVIQGELERMVETGGDIGIYIKGSRKNHLEHLINYFKGKQ